MPKTAKAVGKRPLLRHPGKFRLQKDRLCLQTQAVLLSFGFQDTANAAYCTVVTVFTISST